MFYTLIFDITSHLKREAKKTKIFKIITTFYRKPYILSVGVITTTGIDYNMQSNHLNIVKPKEASLIKDFTPCESLGKGTLKNLPINEFIQGYNLDNDIPNLYLYKEFLELNKYVILGINIAAVILSIITTLFIVVYIILYTPKKGTRNYGIYFILIKFTTLWYIIIIETDLLPFLLFFESILIPLYYFTLKYNFSIITNIKVVTLYIAFSLGNLLFLWLSACYTFYNTYITNITYSIKYSIFKIRTQLTKGVKDLKISESELYLEYDARSTSELLPLEGQVGYRDSSRHKDYCSINNTSNGYDIDFYFKEAQKALNNDDYVFTTWRRVPVQEGVHVWESTLDDYYVIIHTIHGLHCDIYPNNLTDLLFISTCADVLSAVV